MSDVIKVPLSGAIVLYNQMHGAKPGRCQLSPEREQLIVNHLTEYRNKNETARVHKVGLTTIYKICKRRGIRI